jgi:dipeptidyl aminopeptidase/acylaminoacyl peptidase
VSIASTVLAQTELKPPAGVSQDGIPPVPASIARESYPYRSFYRSSILGWDPTKLQPIIAGYTTQGSFRAAIVRDPGKTPESIGNLPPSYLQADCDPNGKYIIYVKAIDANFQHQIYRYDLDTRATTLLTDGKSKNLYPIWSNSGKLLAYSSTKRDGTDEDIYVMDPLVPNSGRLVAEVKGQDWAPFAWSPDDRKLILSDYQSADETYLWLLDLGSGQRTLLTPTRPGQKVFNGSYAFFSKDGRGLYISTDRDSEFRRLAYLDLATKKYRVLTDHIKWDVDDFTLSPDGSMLAFIANEDAVGKLHVMATAAYKEVPVPQLPAGVVSQLRWHPSQPCLGFVFSSTKNPEDVFSLNVATGRLDRWTTAINSVKTDGFREPELVRWASFDGRFIPGFLYRPPESFKGKRPVIINLHGGLYGQFRPSYLGVDNYFIDVLGVVMIYPNVRGSSGYGKTFMSLNDGLLRTGETKDIGALLDWVAGQPDLDSSRVLVQGGSGGGYLALSVAEAYCDRISAVLAYSAPTNLATLIERNSANEPEPWRRELGDERDKKTREFMELIAPSNNADKITKPAFLIIGAKDLMVSVDETQRIVATVRKRGLPAWYLLARDEAHGFFDPWTYEYTFCAEVLFTRQFLLSTSSEHRASARALEGNAISHAGSRESDMPTKGEHNEKKDSCCPLLSRAANSIHSGFWAGVR